MAARQPPAGLYAGTAESSGYCRTTVKMAANVRMTKHGNIPDWKWVAGFKFDKELNEDPRVITPYSGGRKTSQLDAKLDAKRKGQYVYHMNCLLLSARAQNPRAILKIISHFLSVNFASPWLTAMMSLVD